MSDSPTAYICPKCVERYSSDGICSACNISLTPIYTIDCPDCGSELKAGAKHCSHCGASVQKSCSNCGTTLEGDDLFCPDCGNKNEASVANNPKAKQLESDYSHIKGKEQIELAFNPVGLKKFLATYPYLTTGPNSEEYELAVERACNATKEQRVLLRLQSPPRSWAILKPGLIRRLITIVADCCIWGGVFAAGLAFLIGSHKSGGMVRTLGLGESVRPGIAFLWFLASTFIYTAVAEARLGSTIGGFIAGTRVVNPYGQKLTLPQTAGRQFMKFLSPWNFVFGPGEDDYEVVNN